MAPASEPRQSRSFMVEARLARGNLKGESLMQGVLLGGQRVQAGAEGVVVCWRIFFGCEESLEETVEGMGETEQQEDRRKQTMEVARGQTKQTGGEENHGKVEKEADDRRESYEGRRALYVVEHPGEEDVMELVLASDPGFASALGMAGGGEAEPGKFQADGLQICIPSEVCMEPKLRDGVKLDSAGSSGMDEKVARGRKKGWRRARRDGVLETRLHATESGVEVNLCSEKRKHILSSKYKEDFAAGEGIEDEAVLTKKRRVWRGACMGRKIRIT